MILWWNDAQVQIGEVLVDVAERRVVGRVSGAPSPDGRRTVWVDAGQVHLLPFPTGPATSIDLPAVDGEVRWIARFAGPDRVYAHATSWEVDRCFVLDVATAAWAEPAGCLDHDFVEITDVQPGPRGLWVVSSYGEGTPEVSAMTWDGGAPVVIGHPWDDLYPYGEVGLYPQPDGFVIVTDCDLTLPRPCMGHLEAEGGPTWAWRWDGVAAPTRLREVAGGAAPSPSGHAWAWACGRSLCVSDGGGRARRFPTRARR